MVDYYCRPTSKLNYCYLCGNAICTHRHKIQTMHFTDTKNGCKRSAYHNITAYKSVSLCYEISIYMHKLKRNSIMEKQNKKQKNLVR